MGKKKKNIFTHRTETIKELQVQVRAMKRVLWAILEQEGGKYTILPNIFEKAHVINASFDASIQEDGSFKMIQIEYTNRTDGTTVENFENGEIG